MRRVLILGLLFAIMGLEATAQEDDDGDPVQELIQDQDQQKKPEKSNEEQEEEEQQEEKQVHRFKVNKHLFATSVYADREGMCKATGNRQLKAWYVAGFPAEIPPFESCTTISSKTTAGEVEIELTIYSSKGRSILRIDGVLDLPQEGKASQAVDWDHLKIPSPGKYFMEIKIEGQKVARFPMLFKQKKGRRRRK